MSNAASGTVDATVDFLTTSLMTDKQDGVKLSVLAIGEIVSLLMCFTEPQTISEALYNMADSVATFDQIKKSAFIH